MKSWTFVNKGGRREPFLINTPVIIANHPKKKKKTKPKGGSIVAKSRKTKRSSARRNYFNPGAMLNRPKKHKAKRRSNPPGGFSLAGIKFPVRIEDALFALAGAVGPDAAQLAVKTYWPNMLATDNDKTAVKIGSYLVPPALALMVSKRAAGFVLFGEALMYGAELVANMLLPAPGAVVKGYIPRLPGPSVTTAAQLGRANVRMRGYLPARMRGYPTAPDRLARRYGSW